ncbi:MAG: PAAR domain-containing protein [Spirosomataceae bacterium]
MGKPAAAVGDMHVCPMVTPGTPPVPHVGGPILPPGAPTVLIGGKFAATFGNMCVCTGPPDSIVLGSLGVFIGGNPAARIGDTTAHGGSIVLGNFTVLVGDLDVSTLTPANIAFLLAFINRANSVVNCGHIIDQVISMIRTGHARPAAAGLDGTDEEVNSRLGINIDPNNPTTFNDVFSRVEAGGPGTMEVVRTYYAGGNGSGHWIVVANVNGQTGAMEGQNWGPGQGQGFITDSNTANARYNADGATTIVSSPVP